jgi:hypothetical protein
MDSSCVCAYALAVKSTYEAIKIPKPYRTDFFAIVRINTNFVLNSCRKLEEGSAIC